MTSLNMLHYLGSHEAGNVPIGEVTKILIVIKCRITLEWGWPYSKCSFGKVYCRIYCKAKYPTCIRQYTSPTDHFEYSLYSLNNFDIFK